ncbi:hypothetical protein RND71_010614 [Anisodus tanguticus]|uniref:Uncharacterized protein n=1 Tax=Anisodus tanguticus TaxID=243964 RepID=A0AAE1VSA9_9SOLA|nr:hypothetical protein RND71_010614 [Anisodus tanguticus]
MKTALWFLGKFLLSESGDRQIKIKSVLKFAENAFGSDSKFDFIDVLETIESFRYNIPDGCGTYVETTAPAVTATPLTHEPVVEYIDNVVQNVKDLLIVRLDGKPPAVSNEVQSSTYASAKAQVELVEKELRALRNFKDMQFRTTRRWQTLLCHADYVATYTEIAYYMSVGCSFPDKREEMIQPIKPRVRVMIYTDVQRYLKLSGTLVVISLIEAADGFMQTLQQMSMEVTESSSLTVHQKESLAEQLNSLRIFVTELPLINEIQDEMKMHFFKRLSRVVIHAALVVYSFGDSNKEDWHQELLVVFDTIRSVKIEIYRDIREWVTSHLPKDDKLGFSSYLLDSLKGFLSGHSASLASVKNQLEVVDQELNFFEPFLMREAEQVNNKHNELQNLVGRVVDKAYEVEYILDSFAIRDVPLSCLTMWLSEIIRETELIKTELTKPKEKNMTSGSATNEELVGFGDVWITIRDQLVRGKQELDVSIVGMAGSGRWGENENCSPVLDSLSQLETLKVVFTTIPEIGPSRLNFPINLKKLTLCKFPLPPVEISTIANLLDLEALKLPHVAFEMDEWEVRDNEFPKLKFLKLENLKLSKW